jgi:hypothetical protein
MNEYWQMRELILTLLIKMVMLADRKALKLTTRERYFFEGKKGPKYVKRRAVLQINSEISFQPTPPALVEIRQLLPAVDADGNNQPLTAEQLRLLFNQQLEHYIQETEVYKSENQLLKDQLMLERNARSQAQVRIAVPHYTCTPRGIFFRSLIIKYCK